MKEKDAQPWLVGTLNLSTPAAVTHSSILKVTCQLCHQTLSRWL